MKNASQSTSRPPAPEEHGESLAEVLQQTGGKCTECMACVRHCNFLQQYGTPKKIAASCSAAPDGDTLSIAYQCSLCRLCTAVCPAGVDPARLFLLLRRQSVDRGRNEFPRHRLLTGYERRGTSALFSLHMLPENCSTVLFPGCALSGSRPRRVKDLFLSLREKIPQLGIVLDCCTKPSHDLGRSRYFETMFGSMLAHLLRAGVAEVLVACPSCHWIFKHYAPQLGVRTVYEVLAEGRRQAALATDATVAMHDPCSTRFVPEIQTAARRLTNASGLKVLEMRHRGKRTLCCGEGGAAGYVAPHLAAAWTEKRRDEARDIPIVTYCAGCSAFLGRHHQAHHLLDLYFDPARTMAGKARVSSSPFTYLNRLLLKQWFKRRGPAAPVRQRPLAG